MRTANPTTNFVNDYAMKRQKQMDRAKQIREERQARQQQQPSGGAPLPATQQQSDYPSEGFTAPRRSARPRELSGASDAAALTVLQVSEEDLRKATDAGIVTPDQARQLWAMLSNQAIRVAPSSSSHVQADPHGFTMLSHTSSLSSTVSSPGFQPFGHSVTIESLKESIAQFKANQRQQQQTGRSRGGYPEQQQQQPTGRKSQSSNNRHYDEPEDEEPEEEEPYSPPDPIRTRAPVGGAARSRGARKPQWNDDVDVPGEPEPAPPPPTTASTRTSTQQKGPIVSKRPTKASTTAGARNRRPAGGTGGGGGGGLDDMPVGRGQPSAGLDDMPVGRGQPSFGGGGGGLDDMPVGRGQPSAGLDDMPVGRGQQPNDVIQRESQQMAKEAMRGCRHCGRTFRVSVLQRHESSCKDVSKPRRRFDMKQQRLEGVEGIEEAKRNARYQPSASAPAPAKNAMPKWKIQHEQFQAAMKAASGGGGGGGGGGGFGGGGGPPPSQVPDDRVPCPHCGRKFAVETAARHIPHCAHTVNKPKGLARPTRR